MAILDFDSPPVVLAFVRGALSGVLQEQRGDFTDKELASPTVSPGQVNQFIHRQIGSLAVIAQIERKAEAHPAIAWPPEQLPDEIQHELKSARKERRCA